METFQRKKLGQLFEPLAPTLWLVQIIDYNFKYFLQEQELHSIMRNTEELDMEQFMGILLR